MKDCNSLLYIVFLFLISLLLSFLLSDNVEGYEANKVLNYQKIISNPELAGAIPLKYSEEYKLNNCRNQIPIVDNYKIFSKDEYQDELLKTETWMLPPEAKNTVKQFKPRSDAAPYDFILTEDFKRDTPIELPQGRVRYELNRSTNEEGGLDLSSGNRVDVNRDSIANNCMGKWSEWDSSHCNENHRCALKYRIYEVTDPAGPGGDACMNNGEVVNDGDIEYEYCFGSNMERCGTETNSCSCDLDNFSEDKCNIETSNTNCICPPGYYRNSVGKCEESQCTCSNGTPAMGDSCINSGEERCQSCSNVGGKLHVLQNDPPVCLEGSCNCPYGKPDTDCALPTDVNCLSCEPNYKLSTSLQKCREYYGDWGLTVSDPVKCCLPDNCKTDSLDDLNIEKKINDTNCDENNTSLHDCVNSFHCKDGYSFKPLEEYKDDEELKIIKCADDNSIQPYPQPKFNGQCVPVKCPVSDFLRNIYEIPDSVLVCDSNVENCGLQEKIKCKVPEHSTEDNAKLKCLAPHKVKHDDINPIGFLSMSGCQNNYRSVGEELFLLSISKMDLN